ncbi:glycerol-3-phosphate dehydrogenase [Oleomonas cavernae]|uniref:Glycerol-3-phosphate dehydrogenase n=1 Tax=Oleomonas cavernae TaxID=2320859 RepID=A0A418WHR3_9PROT|nr:heterodisulfide reductase-related iron-sulfur binding cluster [Oleomonas cavernae]RJF89576.1 glycerol-3-phosphate dehydrogenase [Oleomonas cavernae]
MREGSLEAPTRHPLAWNDPDFYDEAKLDAELRRVFDICHGCRRCFNLCDSFPRLFDLVDATSEGEVHGVKSEDFGAVVDACTLCDLCFMTKCPYVPPHEFNLDFPHLMLRYRAVEHSKGETPFAQRQLARTDRNGKLAGAMAGLSNWATDADNKFTRGLMEKAAGIDAHAALPKFHRATFKRQARKSPIEVNAAAPAHGRKAVIYATCFANYNAPEIGMAARAVLARNGVETEVVYPRCCGMPLLEHGNLEGVVANAQAIKAELLPWVDKGYDIVALVPSCALMMKFEWGLLMPDDADIKRLGDAVYDIPEYVVDIAKKEGLAPGLAPLEGGIAVHIACHARAQNMGAKAAEMLKLIPGQDLQVIERCSGHGGSWGVLKEFHEVALKVGKPVARTAAKAGKAHVASECPLAGAHIVEGMRQLNGDGTAKVPDKAPHPIELFARAYGIEA